jgi:hypothetical protein
MWASSHVPGALRDALSGLAEVAVAVPRQMLVLATNIEARMPKEAKVGNPWPNVVKLTRNQFEIQLERVVTAAKQQQ